YAHDAVGRRTEEVLPNGQTPSTNGFEHVYLAQGSTMSLIDPRARTTTWRFDAEGRLRGRTQHGQAFEQVQYDYDPDGKLMSRSRREDGSSTPTVTTYAYDNSGNLASIVYPAGVLPLA